MDGAGDEFFASTVLAGDQHPAAGRGRDGNLGLEIADGRTFADHLRFFAELLLESAVLLDQPADAQGILQGQEDFLQRQRFLDKVVGAEARGLDRSFDGAVPAHHDHQLFGIHFANPSQRFKAVNPWHPDIEKDDVDTLFPQLVEAGAAVGGEEDPVALILQNPLQAGANAVFIINNQNRFHANSKRLWSGKVGCSHRQFDNKAAAARLVIAHADIAMMIGNDCGDNGKSEAGA